MKLFPRLTGIHRTATQATGVVIMMGALAWASVPFYDWFCRVTGFGGTPLIAAENASEVTDETITIRFDATLDRNMPWTFEPEIRTMEVRIGESGLAFYEAHNPTDRPIAGTASYNIAPYAAQGFFVKVDCFCFEMQVLEPGETVMMPVSFFVDPEILDDNEGQYVHTITLSYTFYEADLPQEEQAASIDPVFIDSALTPGSEPATDTN